MNKLWIVMILIALAGSAGAVEQKDAAEQPDKKSRPADAGLSETTEKQPGSKAQAPTWPRPYRPSEEISADTSVPFPTDI